MNLWVKRIGQLTIMSVAQFFLSCQEEVSVLGYKNPNTKFKVSYFEIPVESSVLLRDSLRTSNFFYNSEPNRLLVGSYQDDRFGTVSASAVTQYFPVGVAKLATGAVFDSVSLRLQFDLYHYGSNVKTSQSMSVYKLEDVIKFDNLQYYFNKSSVSTGTLLGNKSFTIDPDDFDDFAISSTDYDTIITVKVPLNYAFGRDIFAAAERYRDGSSSEDSLFVKYNDFIEQFKGLVIRPDAADKAIGFAPSAAGTRLLLHYHTDKDTLALELGLGGVISFNQINGDRSATELAQIQQYHQDYFKDSETRYIQSGTGILTKVDFTNFYNFIDTIPNILVNSAELLVENVESSAFAPPPSIVLRSLTPSNNRLRVFSATRPQDSVDVVRYRGYFSYDFATSTTPALVDNDQVFYLRGDKGSSLAYSSTKRSYSGVFTLLFQQMSIRNDDRTPLTTFVLYPGSDASSTPAFSTGAKSLNRAVFPKSGIKLRIYYTKPLNVQ
ncbi:MAG TPA: DUF4270 family protein [Chryseolinea sp.]|nr:DUF4270 family protein [Chryseolinea sp.]